MNKSSTSLSISLSEDQMSFMNSGKGLKAKAKKAWKILTSKIQCKILHKLTRSKAITKKPSNGSTSKTAPWLSLSFRRGKRKRRSIKRNSSTTVRSHQSQKRSVPVYIDELFIEPSHIVAKGKQIITASNNISTSIGPGQMSSHNKDVQVEADEMWESLALASPQMQGINERADAFIARFRAEMMVDHMKIVANRRL